MVWNNANRYSRISSGPLVGGYGQVLYPFDSLKLLNHIGERNCWVSISITHHDDIPQLLLEPRLSSQTLKIPSLAACTRPLRRFYFWICDLDTLQSPVRCQMVDERGATRTSA